MQLTITALRTALCFINDSGWHVEDFKELPMLTIGSPNSSGGDDSFTLS